MSPFAIAVVIGLAILGVPLLWIFGTYNRLISLKNRIKESWADVDTELKRRYDLIPNLVEAVRGYMKHEEQVLQRVVEARSRAAATENRGEHAKQENEMVRALDRLMVVAENYPDLKASANFMQLQEELVNTEDRIQAARRFFNANIRDYNNVVESVPSNLIANWFQFKPETFFEIEQMHMRNAPGTQLRS